MQLHIQYRSVGSRYKSYSKGYCGETLPDIRFLTVEQYVKLPNYRREYMKEYGNIVCSECINELLEKDQMAVLAAV